MNDDLSEAEITCVWRKDDPAAIKDAVALWRRLDALHDGVKPGERAKELFATAYADGKLVAVSTMTLSDLPIVRCRFGFFRCLVDPQHRRRDLGRKLLVFARDNLSEWSRANPDEKVMGLCAVIETPLLEEWSKVPVWPTTGLSLIGYTAEGHQVRIFWFEHARLD